MLIDSDRSSGIGEGVGVPPRWGSVFKDGESTFFFACMMTHRSRRALSIDTTLTPASVAFDTTSLAATRMRSVFVDSRKFVPRTIAKVLDGVNHACAPVALIEAQQVDFGSNKVGSLHEGQEARDGE